jgi:NADH:ubiquinone oxidoreductase subunit 3 (subunit A)
MKHESGPPSPIEPREPDSREWPQPVSNTGLVLFFAGLAVALVLGYLFLNKLVDISREEDCALAHRYNCGAVEVPSNRQ